MRLSRTMTSKNKAAGLPRGGGKMVVNTKGPLSVEQAASLGVFVDFINKDGHIYTTGGDMNCGERELSMIVSIHATATTIPMVSLIQARRPHMGFTQRLAI